MTEQVTIVNFENIPAVTMNFPLSMPLFLTKQLYDQHKQRLEGHYNLSLHPQQ